MDNDEIDSPSASELRDQLVDGLVGDGIITSADVEAAFRTVPRQVFTPGVSLEEAYARHIVVVKRDDRGAEISTVTAPQIQARMLEQAEIRPGMRVLEVGSGGYNAALIAELVGPTGRVTTVDIDPDVTERASAFLSQAGHTSINVVLADAQAGVPSFAPYDRILVTAGAWDIPPAWTQQLAQRGRILVPLRMRGVTRSLALEAENDRLVSRSAEVCGFVKMQGSGAHQERLWLLRGEAIGLRFDDGILERPNLLNGVLTTGASAAWSGVRVERAEPFPSLPLWLATALPGFCLLAVDTSTGDPGVAVEAGGRQFPFAVVEGDSFAYLTTRPSGEGYVEFGAHAYGPHASVLAHAFAEQVGVWDRDHRDGPGPRIEVWPIDTPEHRLPEGAKVITKIHRYVTISWPTADAADGPGTPPDNPRS